MNNKDVFYIGVDDHDIDLFEGQYVVENGMSYNSYLIVDDKICIMDAVDLSKVKNWLTNIKNIVKEKKIDYLVIQHMEPDHAGSIGEFVENYPDTTLVLNRTSLGMLKQFFPNLKVENYLEVKENDTLKLGQHELKFIMAPMVHWPEVMVTYDTYDKTLYSADGFGKFGALDNKEEWECEARRYYFGIVGKYGKQVQALLNKAKSLDIKRICPLHGPILGDNLAHYINLYDTWSSYKAENRGVAIFYSSVYGHTKQAALLLYEKLKKLNVPFVDSYDLARSDMAECVEDAFRYDTIVLASITYCNDVFPHMSYFLHNLTERDYQNRHIGIIENGTWAPVAGKVIKKAFENSKDINFFDNTVTIKSALNETSLAQIDSLANEIASLYN